MVVKRKMIDFDQICFGGYTSFWEYSILYSKGVLEIIEEKVFIILWLIKIQDEGIPLVK